MMQKKQPLPFFSLAFNISMKAHDSWGHFAMKGNCDIIIDDVTHPESANNALLLYEKFV